MIANDVVVTAKFWREGQPESTYPPSPRGMATSSQESAPIATVAARRLALPLELSDTAIAMMRQNLRRGDPEADETIIEARLRAWLASGGGHPEAYFRVRPDLE